jgi:copper chaperone CopZ
MKSIITICYCFIGSFCLAQIKNAKKETVIIYGNCGMCESKIEKSGSQKNVSKVDWDADSQTATIVYDSKKTTKAAILQKIANAGYDSELFTAPDKVYSKLPGCCQYDRPAKKDSM